MNKFFYCSFIVLICVLIFLTCKDKEITDNSFDGNIKISVILIVLLFIFCYFVFFNLSESLDNTESNYDIETYKTKNLKVVKKINGLIDIIKSKIPVGYIYLTKDKNADPNKIFGGTWEPLAQNNETFYLMLANDGDKVDYNNKINCAFSKKITDKCPKNNSFDTVGSIEYLNNTVREFGGENETRLNIYNVPPHTQYLLGDSDNKGSNCYENNKIKMCIDNGQLVGNATTKKAANRYKRINSNIDSVWTIKEANDRVRNKKTKIPANEDAWATNNSVKTHNNEPPYYIIYGWRKTKN